MHYYQHQFMQSQVIVILARVGEGLMSVKTLRIIMARDCMIIIITTTQLVQLCLHSHPNIQVEQLVSCPAHTFATAQHQGIKAENDHMIMHKKHKKFHPPNHPPYHTESPLSLAFLVLITRATMSHHHHTTLCSLVITLLVTKCIIVAHGNTSPLQHKYHLLDLITPLAASR